MALVDDLLNLYRVESQVRSLQVRLDSAQRYLQGQERRFTGLNEQQTELVVHHRQHQAKIANLETEMGAIDDRMAKLREELNTASTNKEYTALLTELNHLKENRSELETQALEEMERAEEVQTNIDRLGEDLKECTRKRTQAETELQERREEIGERLAELKEERDRAAAIIPSAELAIFNEQANHHEGEAMAQVEEIDRRNRQYACGACNMHLPFESFTSLMGASESLVRCTACKRILFLQEETRGAFAKK